MSGTSTWLYLVGKPWGPDGCVRMTRHVLARLGIRVPEGALPLSDGEAPQALLEAAQGRGPWEYLGSDPVELRAPGDVAVTITRTPQGVEHHVMPYVGGDILVSCERVKGVRFLRRRALVNTELRVYRLREEEGA